MQNGLQFLCHWIHGIQKQPIIRRNCGTARSSQIRNVVFMGMGEPLNNYSAVVEAVRIMTCHPKGLPSQRYKHKHTYIG